MLSNVTRIAAGPLAASLLCFEGFRQNASDCLALFARAFGISGDLVVGGGSGALAP